MFGSLKLSIRGEKWEEVCMATNNNSNDGGVNRMGWVAINTIEKVLSQLLYIQYFMFKSKYICFDVSIIHTRCCIIFIAKTILHMGIFGYQFMFRSPKQRLGRLGIIEGQGQASVLVFSIMG